MNENEEPTYEELKESNRVLSNIIVNQNDRLANGARELLAQGYDAAISHAPLTTAERELMRAGNPYRESSLPDFGAVIADFENGKDR